MDDANRHRRYTSSLAFAPRSRAGHSARMTGLPSRAVGVLAAMCVVVGCGSNDASDSASSFTATTGTGLECAGAAERLLEYDLDPERPGAVTAEEAAAEALSFYIDQHGGEVVMVRSDAYGMKLKGRTVVVADVTQAPAGGFWANTVHVCDAYVPVETGPPKTAAPVGTDR